MASPGQGLINVGLADAKLKFFDRQVFTAKEKAQARVLSKFGSYVRSDARKSMRSSRGRTKTIRSGPRKGEQYKVYKPSAPGNPPKAIEGLIKRFLFFLYEQKRGSVIIGPIKLRTKKIHGRESNTPVPSLHEYGGSQIIDVYGKTQVATYPARPFMQPAAEKNIDKLGRLWRNAIR